MAIKFVVDTHVHADHRSTGRELAREAGAEYVLFADAGAAYEYREVVDGEQLELGNVRPPDASRVRAENLGLVERALL